jgi:hypothetical protein
MSDWIPLAVKFKGKCAECGKEIPQGERALWSRASKAIKHVKCETPEKTTEKKEEKMPEVQELDCFVCGKPAGCAECGFEADCDRQVVSQACICSTCLEDKQAFQNYQQAFVEKARKVAKVKI